MFTNAFSMLYNIFERRDSLFSSLTFAMIANDAHSSHGIVLLLVLKVRKAFPFSIWGGALSTQTTMTRAICGIGCWLAAPQMR
jgi:MFS-type transporter involved in bile tolerance (Atg22 family)